MRIGLLADIHGEVNKLSKAIEQLHRAGVDEYVVLGDIIYDGANADATVNLLTSCNAHGVWGNHELGLCVDPSEEIRAMFSDRVMKFFAELKPSLRIVDAIISHTFPSEDPSDLYSFHVGQPTNETLLAKNFERVSHRVMLCGHFHRWFAATPDERLPWNGTEPLRLHREERYFIVINAVMKGFTAILDLETNVLTPLEIS